MRLLLILAVVVVLAGAASLLYCVPPVLGGIYPACLFHALTGLHCPGCGSTRCLHALLHGDLRQAAAWNVLLLLALPYFVCAGARFLWNVGKPNGSPGWRFPPWTIYVLIGVVM